MRRSLLALLILTACGIAAPAALAQAGGSTSSDATVEIVSGLSITNTGSLEFGDIVTPETAGTVVVSPAGALAASGVIHAGGTVSSASFNVHQSEGQPNFYVIIPASITISSGASTMLVDQFTTSVTNPGACVTTGGPAPGPRGQCPKAPYVLDVGARLHVGAAQPAGNYSGTFEVTVSMF
jgi:hypothetical protein